MRTNPLRILSSYTWSALWLAVFLGLTGCRSNAEEEPPGGRSAAEKAASSQGDKNMTLHITSTAFVQGHAIPKKYTGEGADTSPPLAWTGMPEGAKELALICDDPDAPTSEPWVHWAIYKIPAETRGLPEGVPRRPRLKEPHGALQGKNSWPEGDNIGYRGPMPPPGHGVHHYHFKLYALDSPLTVEPGLDKKALLQAISDCVIEEGELMGTYER